MSNKRKPEVFFLSTYPPRGCGIATFTNDLVTELNKNGNIYPSVIAMDDGQKYYSEDVIARIGQQDQEAYKKAADLINCSADLLMIEHEYGIYGGRDGEYLLSLIEGLRIPYMVTCHTVLPCPGSRQRSILAELCHNAVCVVVMSGQSAVMLRDVYGADSEKLHLIHHGVPQQFFFDDKNLLKQKMGLDGKTIISTFGLLSPGKGLEYGIQAVAETVKDHPNTRYLILGQTHPAIKKESGEAYRESLEALVDRLGIKENIIFINQYLSQSDIMRYLHMSDIYMTPYLSKNQAVSGTLAYAIGSGCAVVSTPYIYAEEMLADGRGLLAEFESAPSLTRCLNMLIENPETRAKIAQRASALGRTMAWPRVAEAYEDAFLFCYMNRLTEILKEGYHGKNERAKPHRHSSAALV